MTNLPTPDFTFDPNAPGACIAGVRPYRNGSYRLDAETASGKFIADPAVTTAGNSTDGAKRDNRRILSRSRLRARRSMRRP